MLLKDCKNSLSADIFMKKSLYEKNETKKCHTLLTFVS
ncbi:hypothetical protein Bateq7PJ16_0116 [Bacillus subtilis]|nr:hypothetical protein Bateq7PJ16_0116 [Bacillus subtilis]GAK78748.1 hypothetical protein BSMD_006480 [Bacillus subtilis Miyagi-4]CCU59809.1 hypothetical protein BSUBE1_3178 [Bacillus subtilis E1]